MSVDLPLPAESFVNLREVMYWKVIRTYPMKPQKPSVRTPFLKCLVFQYPSASSSSTPSARSLFVFGIVLTRNQPTDQFIMSSNWKDVEKVTDGIQMELTSFIVFLLLSILVGTLVSV